MTIELDPAVLTAKAHYLREHDHLAAARAYASAAVDLAPTVFDGWLALGLVAAKQRDYASAVAAYVRALEIAPNDIACWTDLGELLLALLDLPGAARALSRAIALDKDATHPHGRRARALVARTLKQLRAQS
jgi:tetratricopeptide (TPR) repeat protein